jgi:glycosyltransferase involved in cell wall biosynthesis
VEALASRESTTVTMDRVETRVIGRLGVDAPWNERPPRVGKLYSAGNVARNEIRALQLAGHVVRQAPSTAAMSLAEQRTAMALFLREIDLLWCDCYPGSALALQVRHELDLPCPAVLSAMGTLPKGAEAMLFPWRGWLRPGDGILFTCRADQAIWRRLVKESALREWVIPFGVDETLFHPRTAEERSAARARLGVPAAAPLLLYVGRLNIQKNLHTLLYLLRAVREQVPNVHLCLVGGDDDIVLGEFGVRNTGYVAYLRRLAADLGVGDVLRFVGPLFDEDLARAYAAADVLVNAGFYHRENFGLAQAEAQACGLPVICSDWGGFKDVIVHAETGYSMETVLTKNGIRVDWATGARHVTALLRDPDLRACLGSQAAARGREVLSVTALSKSLGRVVAEAAPPPNAKTICRGPAYQPSAFAQRYEAHKRECGWYAAEMPQEQPVWYPPMFRGRDYALYETLMAPYATRLAHQLPADRIRPDSVPYRSFDIECDRDRHLARNLDPVWGHHAFLRSREWHVLQQVDGVADVNRIVTALTREGSSFAPTEVTEALWWLHMEGFVLFSTA